MFPFRLLGSSPRVPGLLDHALIVFFLLTAVYEWRWYWPRIVRGLAAGVPGVRARAYRNILIAEWAVSAAVVALWLHTARPWEAFRLGPASPLRVAAGMALAAGYTALAWQKVSAITSSPARIERVRRKFTYADALVPHTDRERRAFTFVAITAGLCEEFLFRGFALWYCTALAGPVAGFALAAVLFGFGHVYLGYAHVLRTAIVGAVLGAVVLLTGSLWPAIVLHAAMDLIGGELGFRVFREAPPAGAAPAAAAGA